MSEEKGCPQSSQTTQSSPIPVTAKAPPDSLTEIINTIADRVEPVISIITTITERSLKSKESESRFRTKMSIGAAIVIIFVVLVAGGLTYVGRVDGSTFSFLLGTIVGYVLTYIREAIYPIE